MTVSVRIHIAKIEDSLFLAACVDTPRFCVSASTRDEALAKAERALRFHDERKHLVLGIASNETLVISPAFETEELCAA